MIALKLVARWVELVTVDEVLTTPSYNLNMLFRCIEPTAEVTVLPDLRPIALPLHQGRHVAMVSMNCQ